MVDQQLQGHNRHHRAQAFFDGRDIEEIFDDAFDLFVAFGRDGDDMPASGADLFDDSRVRLVVTHAPGIVHAAPRSWGGGATKVNIDESIRRRGTWDKKTKPPR